MRSGEFLKKVYAGGRLLGTKEYYIMQKYEILTLHTLL